MRLRHLIVTTIISIMVILISLMSPVCAQPQSIGVTEDQAMNALLTAEEDMQEMMDAGFGVKLANDTLEEAKKAFTGENYTKLLEDAEKINDTKRREEAKKLILVAQKAVSGTPNDYNIVLEKTDEVRKIKERAFEVDDLLKALEMRTEELSSIVNVSDVKQISDNANKEFNSESYDNAEELANQGFDLLDKKAAEATQLKLMYRAGKENVMNFVNDNWKMIIIVFAALVIASVIIYKISSVMLLRSRLKELKLEKDVLDDLIKKAQSDRFQKGLITKREYEIKIQRFKERIIEVDKEIPILISKLKGEK